MQSGQAGRWRFTIRMRNAAQLRQYQAWILPQCLAGTCVISTPRELAVERIGKVLAVSVAKRGRAARVNTTAA